jgi:hypothetical protein
MTAAGTNWTEVAAIASASAAVGTLVLAGFTWNLARKTADLAGASEAILELAQRELEVVTDQARATAAQVAISTDTLRLAQTPWLVPVVDNHGRTRSGLVSRGGAIVSATVGSDALVFQAGPTRDGVPGDVSAVIPIRNIGSGPALIPRDPSSVIIASNLFGGLTTLGRPDTRVIAPGDVAYLVFSSPYGQPAEFTLALPPQETGASAVVDVTYTDIGGRNKMRSRFIYGGFDQGRLVDAVVAVEPVE